jgi:hypothetical protein
MVIEPKIGGGFSSDPTLPQHRRAGAVQRQRLAQ